MNNRADTSNRMLVNLKEVKFDPANSQHTAALKNHIQCFSSVFETLFKADVMISVPISVSLLLWMAGIYGIGMECLLLMTCAVYIWAGDKWQGRNRLLSVYQTELNQLMAIYEKIVKDHGYGVMQDISVLTLLKTLAPHVETYRLWRMSPDNPADYPDEFKKILLTPPHCVPFVRMEVAPDQSPGIVGILAATLLPPAQKSVLEQTVAHVPVRGLYSLFGKVAADVKLGVYGLNEEVKFAIR